MICLFVCLFVFHCIRCPFVQKFLFLQNSLDVSHWILIEPRKVSEKYFHSPKFDIWKMCACVKCYFCKVTRNVRAKFLFRKICSFHIFLAHGIPANRRVWLMTFSTSSSDFLWKLSLACKLHTSQVTKLMMSSSGSFYRFMYANRTYITRLGGNEQYLIYWLITFHFTFNVLTDWKIL